MRPNTYRDTVHSGQKWINRQPWKWTWKVRFCSDKWTKQRDSYKEFVKQLGILILKTWGPQVCLSLGLEKFYLPESHTQKHCDSHRDKTETKCHFNIQAVMSSAGDTGIVRPNHSWLQTCLNQWCIPEWMSHNNPEEMHVCWYNRRVSPHEALSYTSACVCVQRGEYQNTLLLSLAVRCITQTFSILSARAASTLAPSKLSRHFIKWLQTLGRVSGKSLY